MLLSNVRAELAKALRRPANWLLLAVAVTLSLTFAYLIPYAGYAGGTAAPPDSDLGLPGMLPPAYVGNAIAGMPVFAGALAVILGVLVVGTEYTATTWKTVLAQGPSRATVYASKLATIAVATLAMTLVLAAVSAAASALVAAVENQPFDWPPLTEQLAGIGGGWLVALMWASFGALLAVVFRGVALPVGLGLVWLLAVQNLLAGIAAPLVAWIADLQLGLPGPNAGSLVAALGAGTDTPGVATTVGGGQAALVVAAYLVAFAVSGGWLLSRTDLD